MGVNAVLEDERGKEIARVDDPHNLFHRLLPEVDTSEFRCIGFIDQFGDTVFNRLQMDDFLKEWQRMKTKVTRPEELLQLEQVEGLARKVLEGRHLYLKFYGD